MYFNVATVSVDLTSSFGLFPSIINLTNFNMELSQISWEYLGLTGAQVNGLISSEFMTSCNPKLHT